MRLALAATLLALTALPAQSQDARLKVSARVSVQCAVVDIDTSSIANGRIRIDAACNAPAFNLVLGGDLGQHTIRSAQSSQGQVSVASNRLHVQPRAPGRYRLDIDYGGPLPRIHHIQADIQAA